MWLWQVGYVPFTTSRRKSHVFFFQPAMSKKGTIFSSSLDQRIEMLRRLDETHRVEQGACWWAKHNNDMYRTIRSRQGCHPGRVEFRRPARYELCGATKVDLRWLQVFAYCTIPQRLYYYDALILGSITIAYIIMTMHDKGIQYQYRCWLCSRLRCITFGAAHPSLRWAATCHVRTLLPGPEGVRSWEVLLYIKWYTTISI